MGRKEEEEVVAVGVAVYEGRGIPPNAVVGDPKGIPIQQTIYRDTPAPFNCPYCANTSLTVVRSKPSLAAFIGCLMPMMLGVCFLCPSMDCLWHKYHYCPQCHQKVADFEKSDPCAIMDPPQWTQESFALASMFWRKRVVALAQEYPDVELSHMYVDNAAMQLVRYPKQFDTIVTNNIFGDILSDEASMITGSIGMLPSASLGDSGPGLFEPIHGSAPDIAGQDKANPFATVLSAAMLLKYGLGEVEAAERIESAVLETLNRGFRTADIYSAGTKLVGCKQIGEEILKSVESHAPAAAAV